MKVQLMRWLPEQGWQDLPNWANEIQLVLYFGNTTTLAAGQAFSSLRALLPQANLLGCSSSSQIVGEKLEEDCVSAIALHFARTSLQCFSTTINSSELSEELGQQLAGQLQAPDLRAVLIFSDGLYVNGSGLVRGLSRLLGDAMPIFGGLASDGSKFEKTLVGLNKLPEERQIAVVGMYGDDLRISQAAAGGWDAFGPKRTITSSEGNLLLTLDGKPALDLYERYLGDEAQGLPGTALLYPLCIWDDATHPERQVRTVLSVDPQARTMTFAGDIPTGWSAQLMRGMHERLVAGAARAATVAKVDMGQDYTNASLALLVSCVGRRLLMGSKTADEAEAVHDVLGDSITTFGFYSYGEIAPRKSGGRCDLHNQTMTVALIGEAEC